MKGIVTGLFLALFLSSTCMAQELEISWYKESVHEQLLKQEKTRKQRAETKLKSLRISGTGLPAYEENYDRNGRVTSFSSQHHSSYSEDDDLVLENEWTYAYDGKGNLIRASNRHDFLHTNPSPGGDTPRHRVETLVVEATWDYAYNSSGQMVGQKGQAHKEPFDYHRTNAYRVYDTQDKSDWKFDYEYDKGRLVKRLEYRTNGSNAEKLVYKRVFGYDSHGNVVKEILYSGDNIVKYYSFKYDEKGRLVERDLSGERVVFRYDAGGNITQAQLFNHNGKLMHQQDSEYNDKGLLVERRYSVSKVNKSQEDITCRYQYDDQGRPVRKTAGGLVFEYEYYKL